MHSLYLVGPIYLGVLLGLFVLVFGPVIAIVGAVIYVGRRGRTHAGSVQLSNDGKWFWDGQQWRSAISEDGLWRWDGREWKRIGDSPA
jgi:nitric oxide reductase large subunit